MKDPELIAEAGKMKLGLAPKSGEAVEATKGVAAAELRPLLGQAERLLRRLKQVIPPPLCLRLSLPLCLSFSVYRDGGGGARE